MKTSLPMSRSPLQDLSLPLYIIWEAFYINHIVVDKVSERVQGDIGVMMDDAWVNDPLKDYAFSHCCCWENVWPWWTIRLILRDKASLDNVED